MRYKTLYIIFILLNTFDLIVSYLILDPSTEVNPFMKALWLAYGYMGVTMFKAFATTFGLAMLMFAESKSPRLVLTALIISNSALAIVCSMLVYTWLIIEGVIR